jgi:L-lactate dehydrogenase complex protein LldG
MTALAHDLKEAVASFAARVNPLGVRVEHLGTSAEAVALAIEIAGEIATAAPVASVELVEEAPELAAALAAAGLSIVRPSAIADTRDAPLGLSLAKGWVVETGSMLMAEPTLLDRAVAMLSKTNIVFARAEDLLPSLIEAAAVLKQVALRPGGGYGTLVTGPSRTADIEMSLSLGVQGPERVIYAIVDRLT